MVFQTPSEISIKAVRVEYAEFIALLSVLQGNVDMNLKGSEYLIRNISIEKSC